MCTQPKLIFFFPHNNEMISQKFAVQMATKITPIRINESLFSNFKKKAKRKV